MKRNLKPRKIISSSWNTKLFKKIFYSLGLSSLLVVPLTLVFTSTLDSQFIQSNSLKENKKIDDNLSVTIDNPDASAFQNQVKPLVPLEASGDWPLLTSKQGPIVSYGNKITALDWYGGEIWSLDTVSMLPQGITTSNMTTFTNRAFINWDLDYVNNKLWILTNTGKVGKPPKQKLVKVDAITGKIEFNIDLANQPENLYRLYYYISVLQSGKVLIYGQGNEYWWLFDLYDPATNTIKNYNKKSVVGNMTDWIGNDNRMKAFYPIGNNYNVGVLTRFTKDDKFNSKYFVLLDDEFNRIINDKSSEWYNAVMFMNSKASEDEKKIASSPVMAQKYKFIDSKRTLFVFGNSVFIFWDEINSNNTPQYQKFILSSNQIVDSFTVDTNENVFFKYKDDTKINKLVFLNSNYNSMSYNLLTYYDLLGSSIDEIRNGATRFKLYNVYQYAGQILLIEAYTREILNNPPPEATTLSYPCGLQVGITSNANNPDNGDTKGLLNTNKAFQFAADFTINPNVLSNKLPSEITMDDLTLLNNSFFTQNLSLNPDGTIKYLPFKKTNVNDKLKSFTIEVNLDQIPWFTNTLPKDFVPLKIIKKFDTSKNIETRVNWKSVNDDYDFKNTLPSKVNDLDLKRFNPFLIDLSSQKVINKKGEQLYPKKEYSTTTKDDATGKITIECKYTYMPLGMPIDISNELSYSFSQDFFIFKDGEQKEFKWNTNGNTSNTLISNISTIPSLKKFTEANILPSSIKTNNFNELLNFIDLNSSKGYPISKMKAKIMPDDSKGNLMLNLELPKEYYGTEQSFSHTYTNLNKTIDYRLDYKNPVSLNKTSSITQTNYSKMLPSQVTEEQVFMDFVTYSGYDGLDLLTTLLPNDANGTLTIQVELTNNYPISVASISPFQLINGKYIASKTFTNFLTQEKFQQQYVLKFKDNNDSTLTQIKNMEVSAILSEIKTTTGLIVGNQTYKSKSDLAKLFVASKGISIPEIQDSNVTIYSDNQSGILTFELVFPQTETGLNYDLSFTQTFTGFLQGVTIPTQDIFIFKNQGVLAKDLLNKLPSIIAKELENTPAKIKDYFVSTLAGQFEQLIQDPSNYTITTYPNDLTGTLGITIKFNGVTDSQTLTLYSKMYSGFKTIS